METLHPRVRLLWAARRLFGATILAGIALAVERFAVSFDVRLIALGWVLLVAVGVAHSLARYRRWAFEIQDDALYLRRGVITQVDTSVPYVRIQHTDTQRGPIERLAGLGSVVVYTAGSRGADITVPGLRPERADRLRERLRDLAAESEATDAV